MHYDFMTRREMIREMLLNREKITSGELARKFCVSKNTIIHDIWLLSQRIPLASTTGRNGGYAFVGERTVTIGADDAKYLYAALERYKNEDGEIPQAAYERLKRALGRFAE